MRVIIADDQANVRFALKTLLRGQSGIDVVAEATDVTTLMSAIQEIHPDLVLLDWSLPGVPAAEQISRMRGLCPELAVIVISGHLEARGDAREAGADRFISKADPPADLLAAIRSVVRG